MTDLQGLKNFFESRWGLRFSEAHSKDVSLLLKKKPRDSNPDLPGAILSPLVNGETYFFRYPVYLEILLRAMKSKCGQYDRPRFRVLCAGCSTGEEAYSVAFALYDTAKVLNCRLEIIAVDLRTKAIETARAGIYQKWSLRNMNQQERARYLLQHGAEQWKVQTRYQAPVQFAVHNLMEPFASQGGSFDALIACNVLIYMHEAAVRTSYLNLESCADQDTMLITAPTDPPAGGSWSLLRQFAGWPIYSKKPLDTARVESRPPRPVLEPRRAAPPPRQNQIEATPQPPAKPKITGAAPADDRTLWKAWAQGELQTAAEHVRQKVFFEPEQPLWRFLNGVILWENGWLRRSVREIEKAGQLLESYAPEKTISGICTAQELQRMIDFWRQQHG